MYSILFRVFIASLANGQTTVQSFSEMNRKFDLLRSASSTSSETQEFNRIVLAAKQRPMTWAPFLIDIALGPDENDAWSAATVLATVENPICTNALVTIAHSARHWMASNVAIRSLGRRGVGASWLFESIAARGFGIAEASAFQIMLSRSPRNARNTLLLLLNRVPRGDDESIIGAIRVFRLGKQLLKPEDRGMCTSFVDRLKVHHKTIGKSRMNDLVRVVEGICKSLAKRQT